MYQIKQAIFWTPSMESRALHATQSIIILQYLQRYVYQQAQSMKGPQTFALCLKYNFRILQSPQWLLYTLLEQVTGTHPCTVCINFRIRVTWVKHNTNLLITFVKNSFSYRNPHTLFFYFFNTPTDRILLLQRNLALL